MRVNDLGGHRRDLLGPEESGGEESGGEESGGEESGEPAAAGP